MKFTVNDIVDVLSESTHDSIVDLYDIYSEGAVKTSHKNRLDNYLKKYGYIGDNNKGSITVNGEKYNILRNQATTASKFIDNKPTILLSRDFEWKKNTKRMDATLHHEIGHLKNHFDESPNKAGKNAAYEEQIEGIETLSDSQKKKLLKSKPYDETEFTDKEKKQKENHEVFKKYEKSGTHTTRTEFEADAYASQQKNGEHLARSLRDRAKYYRSPNQINKEMKREIRKADNENNKKVDENRDNIEKRIKPVTNIIDKVKPGTHDKIMSKIDSNGAQTKKELHDQSVKKIKENYTKERLKEHSAEMELDMKQRSKAAKDRRVDKSVYKEENKTEKKVTTESAITRLILEDILDI